MHYSENNLEEEVYDEKFRLMLIGNSNVGKTSIIKRFCKNKFINSFISSVGIDFETKYVKIGDKTINLQIWDTAGQERYKVLAKNYFNQSDGFIIVYDITDRKSFDDVANWIEQIKEYAGEYTKNIIVGNKLDLEKMRKVEKDEGKELAEKYGYIFFETSAQSGKNIDKAFDSLTKSIFADDNFISASRKLSQSSTIKEKDIRTVAQANRRKKCCK